MRRNWAGLTPKLFAALLTSPSNPAWAQVAPPERIADNRKRLKDEMNETLSQIIEHKAEE
jgi:hypothetical protein